MTCQILFSREKNKKKKFHVNILKYSRYEFLLSTIKSFWIFFLIPKIYFVLISGIISDVTNYSRMLEPEPKSQVNSTAFKKDSQKTLRQC